MRASVCRFISACSTLTRVIALGNLSDSIIHRLDDPLPRYWKYLSMHFQVGMLSGKQNIFKIYKGQRNFFFFFYDPNKGKQGLLFSGAHILLK